ncbi:MAG: response regulator, partial [Anaerolineales bacterium]
YYQAVIENSPAAIVLLDMQANVTGWNPAAKRLFGYSEAEALGRNIDDLVARAEDMHDEAVKYSEKALQEKQVHILARRTRKDGSLVDVDVSGLPVNVDGRYVGFIAIYHDVTELQRARQVAEQANQAKSTFLANMSHELRTPLNAIIGFTRIVRRKGADSLPDKQLENLDKVLVSAEHLLSLINSVLDISKIEAGRIEVQPSTFEFAPLVSQVLDTSQPLLREGVRLKADLQDDIPPLNTDQEKVQQILLNLLSNAAKFTHHGEIVLAARRDRNLLRVDVADTGIGIPPEAVERIFEEFQQADSSTTREYGGTGLGLSISRSLARLLGGDLTACSVEGEGSTFSLSLPLRYQKPADENPAQATAKSVELKDGTLLILSIDDDEDVHDLLRENLNEYGYQVVGACSTEEGLRLARELHPFAITLDIMMPGKDGWQVLHELKSDPGTREIPVILLTIVDKTELGYQLGADDYLVKPLEEGALVAALQRIRTDHQSGAELNLLVVDDDEDILDLMRQLLEGQPYRVASAVDGQEALEALDSDPPDLIMLDLLMPRMDGFEFLEALRESGHSIPVIVLTAKTLTASDSDLLEGRVQGILRKNGLDQKRLLEELQQTMESFRSQLHPTQGQPAAEGNS